MRVIFAALLVGFPPMSKDTVAFCALVKLLHLFPQPHSLSMAAPAPALPVRVEEGILVHAGLVVPWFADAVLEARHTTASPITHRDNWLTNINLAWSVKWTILISTQARLLPYYGSCVMPALMDRQISIYYERKTYPHTS